MCSVVRPKSQIRKSYLISKDQIALLVVQMCLIVRLLAQFVQHFQQQSLILTGLCEQLQGVAGLFQQTADGNVLGQRGLQVELVTFLASQINIILASIDGSDELLNIGNIVKLHNSLLLFMFV